MSGGDIGLFLQPDNSIDLVVEGNDLKIDAGLQTAVLISLFTDARADVDEAPAEDSSRRGWWGDVFPSVDGDQTGSKLWLLKREKRTVETLNRAEDYCLEALQWMLDDGVAASIEVTPSWDPDTGALLLLVLITMPDESRQTFRFKKKWDVEAEGS